MKTLWKSAFLATGVALIASPALAQVPGIDIRLNPRIGIYTPVTELTADDAEFPNLKADNSLAVGLGIELDLPMLPVGVRANLDYATGSSVNFDEGELEESNEVTLLAVVGDLIFRPLPDVAIFSPYLFAGGGLKQYEFSFDQGAGVTGFENESDGTIHVGGGLDFGLGPAALNVELGDYISWYAITDDSDSEMQHDIFITAGFSIGMF